MSKDRPDPKFNVPETLVPNQSREALLHEFAESLTAILMGFETVEDRLNYILNLKDQNAVLTTSFGIHSALMLHMVSTRAVCSTKHQRTIPVVWIDTGYLPSETYHFAERLSNLFDLDLRVYQPTLSPARMEALHGKLHEETTDTAHTAYNYLRKVEPMQRALNDLDATIVLSGLRANQTSHRQTLKMVHVHQGRLKVCPILDWNEERVAQYFEEHGLPHHPLFHQGYRSVGDWHSSKPFDPNIHQNERDTRFHGRSEECGLHLETTNNNMLRSESLTSVVIRNIRIDNGGFVLYTKPKCRFCRAAKDLIANIVDYPVKEFEVGKDVSRAELEHGLEKSVKTVPQILFKGRHIGGYDDLAAWVEQAFPGVAILSVDAPTSTH